MAGTRFGRARGPSRALLLALALAALPAVAAADCDEPLPLDPAIVTREAGFQSFEGSTQAGPMCRLAWKRKGGGSASVLMYGPKALASLVGGKERSASDLAKNFYAKESPKGAEPIPGVQGGFTVFDPKTRNRRVLFDHAGKAYLVNVSDESIPLEKLAKALQP